MSKILPELKIGVLSYLPPKKSVSEQKTLETLDVLLKDPLFTDKYTLRALASQMKDPPPMPPENIRIPIMLINGSEDYLFSIDFMKEILTPLKNAPIKKLEIIKGPHLIFHEKTNESVKAIIEWINEIE
ncbi:MAG: alpha/beta fold hydrolase [Promethearchaeota archaeon]